MTKTAVSSTMDNDACTAALGTGGTFLLLDWMDKDDSAHASLRVSPTGAAVRFDW